MRSIIALTCAAALALAPARAVEAEAGSEERAADVFASCHGVFHVMTLLAAKGKYAKDAAGNKATKRLSAKLDKRVTELALEAYEADGEGGDVAEEALADAAAQHVAALGELTRGGKYTRAELEEDFKSCYELMVSDGTAADDDEEGVESGTESG